MADSRSEARRGLLARLLAKLNLRFPGLFVLLLVITVADFFIPDVIPFADEIVLTLLTALFGLWKAKRQERREERPVRAGSLSDGGPRQPAQAVEPGRAPRPDA